jgi:thiol-disulfide isomerase/thioredoxin
MQMSEQFETAPSLPNRAVWLNLTHPPRLERELRGHVVLLDFWTYCCINCMHVLPVLQTIEQDYADRPVAVIGVHAAKFDAEREPGNLRAAIARHRIRHPVLMDDEHEVWRAYGVEAWPTLALIDTQGRLRETLPGEIPAEILRAKIDELLVEGEKDGSLASEPYSAPAEGLETGPGKEPESASARSPLRFPGKVLAHEESLYIADTGNHRVLQANREGRILRAFGESGPLRFVDPQGLAMLDDQLLVADPGHHMLKRVDLNSGKITALAGSGKLWRGEPLGVSPAPGDMALRSPWDVCTNDGIALVAMAGSHQIWLYDPGREIFGPFAGNGTEDHRDGPLREASFAQPSGLALMGRYLFVADSEVSSIRAIDLESQRVETLTGRGLFDFGDQDGTGLQAHLQHPMHVCIGFREGRPRVYLADTFNNKIKSIELESLEVRTILGSGDPSELHEPQGMDLLGEELLICDTNNHRLRLGDPQRGTLRDFPLRD